MAINMNGNTNDTNYRYTMPELNITISGYGNGVYTVFNNIDKLCQSLNHPVEVIMSYIATITGCNYNISKNIITGTHELDKLTQIILEYIKYLIMCPVCNIPETIPKLQQNKKNIDLILCCSACKNNSVINTTNSRINKGIKIIIKYLKSNTWTTFKGNMVLNENKDKNENDFNPFV